MGLERYQALAGEQPRLENLLNQVISHGCTYNFELLVFPERLTYLTVYQQDIDFPCLLHLVIPKDYFGTEDLEVVPASPEATNLSFKGFEPGKQTDKLLVVNFKRQLIGEPEYASLAIRSDGSPCLQTDELGFSSLRVYGKYEPGRKAKAKVLPTLFLLTKEGIVTDPQAVKAKEIFVFLGFYGRTKDQQKLISGFVVEEDSEQRLSTNIDETKFRQFLLDRLFTKGFSEDEAIRMINAVCNNL